jgi:anaerobic glycerol-3-phosphate dehydrogenase
MDQWLIDILRQFPMVVVIGLAIWYAEKRVSAKEIRLEDRADKTQKANAKREDQLRKEAREDRDAEIQRHLDSQKPVAELNERLLKAKDEQIASLTSEVEKLRKELSALTKKLSG